ncbi:hypothetical protein J6590_057407 [Homalodisca vitripennis]|nr:hypothetical protein J6590_057407 [Homalodisca vitripennis]
MEVDILSSLKSDIKYKRVRKTRSAVHRHTTDVRGLPSRGGADIKTCKNISVFHLRVQSRVDRRRGIHPIPLYTAQATCT